VFVHQDIFREVVQKLKNKIKLLSCGSGNDYIGAITVDSSLTKIKSQIDKVRNTTEVYEGSTEEGAYIPPSLIIEPPLDSEVFNEETFGPVITINLYKSDDEAIKLANSTGYGLSASIFGKNTKRLKYISRRINAGSVSINDVLTQYGIADLPFGGKGLSGFGKVHGKEGLRAFSHQKSYMKNRISFKSELWWYRKSKGVEKLLRKLLKWQYS
jgi:acyl-CoA reductase-like NAD-dependent aldehyde dehydrogenase